MDDANPKHPAAIYVGIGVGHYDDAQHYEPLPGAVGEVKDVADLLAGYGYLTHVIPDPGWAEVIEGSESISRPMPCATAAPWSSSGPVTGSPPRKGCT